MDKKAETDVVIAGGGIAGSVAAVALARAGLRVLLIEPSLHDDRRIGGDVVQPVGATALARIGLLDGAVTAGGAWLSGFHVWDGDLGEAFLNYTRVAMDQKAFAIDHGLLRSTLFSAACAQPGVSVFRGARVTHFCHHKGQVAVTVTSKSSDAIVTARLLIGADGVGSHVRELAGFRYRTKSISRLSILTIPEQLLPDIRHGHLFAGGGSVSFAYPLGGGQARLLIDHPDCASRASVDLASLLPSGCGSGLKAAIESLPSPRVFKFQTRLTVVDRLSRPGVALIGDASGTCHPLTASGMTSAILDALELSESLADSPHDLNEPLRRYDAGRRGRQATRIVLASALHDIYTSRKSDCRVLRRAILEDFRKHTHGPSSGVSLLSMDASGPWMLMRIMARSAGSGIFDCCTHRHLEPTSTGHWRAAMGAVVRILRYGVGLLSRRQMAAMFHRRSDAVP